MYVQEDANRGNFDWLTRAANRSCEACNVGFAESSGDQRSVNRAWGDCWTSEGIVKTLADMAQHRLVVKSREH